MGESVTFPERAAPDQSTPFIPASTMAWIYEPIGEELQQVEKLFEQELSSRYEHVNQLVSHVNGFRGKRLRPALVLLSAQVAGDLNKSHLVIAAVVEMIHTATLVHDDVLDGAAMRRHQPTINSRWGVHSSVLLGDYLFTHAFHLAASLDSTLACRRIGRSTNIVCEGELTQIHNQGNLGLTEEEYLAIIQGKTAELCAVSCELGAHYAGSDAEAVRGLRRFGDDLGSAFQICDDLLDLLGEEDDTGKSLGTDVAQQKLTLPLIRILQSGSKETARLLRAILTDAADHKLDRIRTLLESSDALSYARQKAVDLAHNAASELERFNPSQAQQRLQALCEFVVSRSF